MKRLIVIWVFVALGLCSFGQKKIKAPIVLQNQDTVTIGSTVILGQGTGEDNTFKYVYTTSGFPAPAKCKGYEQDIYYFKDLYGEYKAYTTGFVVSVEQALKSGEIEIKTSAKTISLKDIVFAEDTGTMKDVNDTLISNKENRDVIDMLSTIPWGKKQNEINDFYKDELKIISRQNVGKNGYCESQLPDVFIGEHKMMIDFVINSSTNTLSRIILKPTFKLTEKNVEIVRSNIYVTLESMFGKPSTTKKDNSIKIASMTNSWLADGYLVESIYMGYRDFQAIAVGFQPLDKNKSDFRQSKWGNSKLQVKKSESLESLSENKDMIIYKGRVANIDCQVVFNFTDDVLCEAYYLIKEDHINPNDYIVDFKKLKELLTDKYGKPDQDKMIWKNNLLKDMPADYGLAVMSGHLVYVSTWQNELTNIRLMLSGDDFTPSLVIQYASRQYEDIVKEKEKKDMLNDL